MQKPEILPTARSVAKEAKSIPLRMSAIATIGDVGRRGDIKFLESVASSSGAYYVRNAAKSALKRLKKRLKIEQ